ncbi:MAG: radical SAM protein [Peptococcaceae bacterium]|nr:radical SAM protein [Peptococcaceae bacterium]
MLRNIVKLGELTLWSKYRDQELSRHTLRDLFWECTLTCNAACKHCGSNAGRHPYTDELTTEEIKNVFTQIARDMDSGKILISVTGGEPLLRADLCHVMGYASDLGFRWGMTTNGILLDKNNIDKLKAAKMETISISLDGLEETHNSFRGVAKSYTTILENIARLREAGFVKHIQVTTIFHQGNIDEIEALYAVICGLNLDSWRLAPMDPIGRGKLNNNLLLSGTEIKIILDFIKTHNRKGSLRLSYGCPGFLGLDYEKDVRGYYFNCRTGINTASILHTGDIFVCPNVPRNKDLIQGNVREDTFAEVWNHRYKAFRTKDRTQCDICTACEFWDYCLGGAFHTWDTDESKQNQCPYIMMLEGDVDQ